MTNTYTQVTMTLIKTENISKIVENPLCSFIVNNYPSPIKINTILTQGFPSGSEVKNLPTMQEMQVQSSDQEDPLEEEIATHSGYAMSVRLIHVVASSYS